VGRHQQHALLRRPSRGIGAIVLMQVLPFYDEAAMRVFAGFEERLVTVFRTPRRR
jgi:hypothetical protein